MTNGSKNVAEFRPFLVEGGRKGWENIFRVVDVYNGPSREGIETLLSNLPVLCKLRKFDDIQGEGIKEPLEVKIDGPIFYVYPPRHRVISCVTMDSWGSAKLAQQIKVDNMADLESPGNGQIRCCIHFNPKILGVDPWWGGNPDPEMEIDFFTYWPEKQSEPVVKVPRFGKHDVRKLIELVRGSEGRLTVDLLRTWRELIMFTVNSMRSIYENPYTPKDYPVRVYYSSDWEKIDKAQNDEQLVLALESLVYSIELE